MLHARDFRFNHPVSRGARLRKLLSAGLLLAGLIGLASTSTQAAEPVQPLKAGAYAMDITPLKFPISVNGNLRDGKATGVHDPLHARCLVLDNGATRLAIVVCDSCMIPREVLDSAKQQAHQLTKIPVDRMLISATHTHTAPSSAGVFQSDPDADYQKFLAERIAQGIQKAVSQLEPAKIGWAVGLDGSQVFNRRWWLKPGSVPNDPFGRATDVVKMNPGIGNPNLIKPAGPIDPEVSVLSVQAADGRPIAVLANYSLHYVGGYPALSADYYGAFAERITQLVGADKVEPPFVGIMSNGTSGDINNVNFSLKSRPPRGPGDQIRLVADSVGRAAFAAYQRIQYTDRVPLIMREAEIELGVRRPDAADLEAARKILAAAKAANKTVLMTASEVYARETVLMNDYPETVKAKLQAIRIGDLGITAIPCEVFVEIGLAIKKQSPLQPTFTIELANGYNGYLPTPEQHKWGGYETWRARSSYLEVGASPRILDTLSKLLKEVADAAPQSAKTAQARQAVGK